MKPAPGAIWLIGILVCIGALWGATQPLAKVAVSEGYRAPGLVFWQLCLGAVFLGLVCWLTGRGLPRDWPQVRICLVIALVGTILPNTASYEAIRHIPAGLSSIVIAMVPLFAFPIALLMATERFAWLRLAGLLLGFVGVSFIVLPEASLPDRGMAAFVPLALIAPLLYAFEGNIVAKWGTAGLDAIQVLYGASLIGVVIALPYALTSGTFIDPRPPWGAADAAVVASALLHALAYTGYVWLVGRAGPIFAVQVSYLVTGFGVLWAMLFLGERFSSWVWAAMAIMFAAIFLVQPRRSEPVAGAPSAGETTEAAGPRGRRDGTL